MKRKNALKILLGSMALSVVAAAAALTPNVTASAENVAEEDFVVIGASVRYDEDATGEDDGTGFRVGLRAKDTYLQSAEEIGFLIIPSTKLGGEELTVYTEDAVMNQKVYSATDASDEWTDVADETAWAEITTQISYVADCQVATSYVYGIPVTASETEITVRGYAKVDGKYVYTAAKTRSMRSVAVAASKDSDNSAEMRSALTKYMDAGNVAYLGSDYNEYNVTEKNTPGKDYGISQDKGSAAIYQEKGMVKTPAGVDAETLHVNTDPVKKGWFGIRLLTPAIKDISSYQYMYVWAYAVSNNNLSYRIQPNEVTNVALMNNAWTQIVFKNVDGTWKVWKDNAAVGNVFGSNGVTATNMDKFYFSLVGTNTTEQLNVHLKDMYVCNELPTITVETTAQELQLTGTAIEISKATENLDTAGVTFTNYVVCDGVATKLEGTSYTPTKAGTYKFVTYAEKDGKLLAMGESAEIIVQEEGKVDLAYFTNENCFTLSGATVSNNNPGTGYTLSRGTGEYASPLGGSSLGVTISSDYWVWAPEIRITNMAIQDISSYKYVYMWIYVTHDADDATQSTDVRIGFQQSSMFDIVRGQWTRLVFTRNDTDGNFYAGTASAQWSGKNGQLLSSSMINTDLTTNLASTTNKFVIGIYGKGYSYAGTTAQGAIATTYFGGLVACNELPELPAGAVNWAPAT